MVNVIYIGENYIAGVSHTFGAKIHRHPLIEIYVSSDGKSHIITERGVEQGAIIVIGPNADHAIADTEKPGIALFLDPLTETGYSLWRNTIGDQLIAIDAGYKGHPGLLSGCRKIGVDLSVIQYVFTSHNGFTDNAQSAFHHIEVIPDLNAKGVLFDETAPYDCFDMKG